MVSLDLQDAYLQIPIHHDSRRYLRFVVGERTSSSGSSASVSRPRTESS